MEFGKLPGPDRNVRPGTRLLPFEIDLNETPLPSPRETLAVDEDVPVAARDGVFFGGVRGSSSGSSGKAAGDEGVMLLCCSCGTEFRMKFLPSDDQRVRELKCFKCLLNNGSGRSRSGVGLLDINASPPREADGEGFPGQVQNSGDKFLATEAQQNGDKVHALRDISFTGYSLNAPVTTSNVLYPENRFDLLKASRSVTQIPKSVFEDIVQHRLNRTSREAGFCSTLKEGLCPSHSTPLNFLPEIQSEVYLQALREYLHEKQGSLGDGWRMEFPYCMNRCKTIPIYCAPDGSRFESMSDVAGFLGLLTKCHSSEIGERSGRFSSLQKGLHSNQRQNDVLTFSRSSNHRETQNIPRSSSVVRIPSGIGILDQKASEFESSSSMDSDYTEHGRHGFAESEDVLPLQFEDLFVLSLGKVDPRPSYHESSQIWPVGYKSCWHDKITGSIFVSEVVDGGAAGPDFKVRRYPCSTHPIPIGSTVLLRHKSDSYSQREKVANDESTASGINDDENPSIQMMLAEDSPPHLEDIDFQKASGLTTESSCVPQRFVNAMPDDIGLSDCIGEFLVEGRSSSLVWEMASETILCACHKVYKQRGVVQFRCKHNVNGVNVKSADNIDSLSKFCYMYGPNDIPQLIQSSNEFDTYSEMLMEWLRQDRFGLDMEFVQEILEELPGVHACSDYNFLNQRSQNSGSQTVRSGFLLAKRKNDLQGGKGADGIFLNCKRPLEHLAEQTTEKCFPIGKSLSAKLPSYLIGDALQAWEFLWRFSDVLGLKEPISFQELENELINPWLDALNPLEGAEKETQNCGDATLCTGAALRKAHSSLLKVVVGELLSKVAGNVDPNSDAGECKSRRGRKKDADNSFTSKRMKFDKLQINELTWPELARRYILVVLSMGGNLDSAEITCRESSKIFHCLQGDGGTLCGSLIGVAGMEADALLLAEASKRVVSPVKKNEFATTDQDKPDAISAPKMIKVNGSEVPEWAQALEPVRKLPTNVGARIRKCVYDALHLNPPEWAKKILEHSISKEVYKGNASGPTKRAIVSLLADVSCKYVHPKPDKTDKVKSVTTVSDLITKQCRVVLRRAAAEDEEKVFCNLLGRTLLNPTDNDDEGLLGYPAMVSRPLDFRTIDIRLAAGAYGGSHESFLEDVQEVWNNIRTIYADQSDLVDLAENLYHKFEDLYEKEVLVLVQKFGENSNSSCISDEAKKEMDDLLIHVNESSLPKAPWDEGVCKVCGVDKDDDNVLLCDTCDSEYHTYCLTPPLARIPEGNWYCPSCIVGQFKSQGTSRGIRVNCGRKKRYLGEFTQNVMEALSRLARTMGSKEYWEFSVEERVLLIKFLCDEALNSSILRDHLEHCANVSADLQQKVRFLSSEWKNLKFREEILGSYMVKANAVQNRVGELTSDGLACLFSKDSKLTGQLPNRCNTVSSCSGNFRQPEEGPQWNGPNDYNEWPYWSFSKTSSEKPINGNRNQNFKGSDAVGQVQYPLPDKGQNSVPENHSSHTHSAAKGTNRQDELPPCIPQQLKNDMRLENMCSPLTAQQGLKDSSSGGSLLTSCQVQQGITTHMNSELPVDGNNSSFQSDASALQANHLEMSSLKHEISVLQDSITRLESELQKVSVRKELLGRDSAGRLYWVFGRPDACSLMVVNGSMEVGQNQVTKHGGPTGNNSNLKSSQYGTENPSSSRGQKVSNVCEYAWNDGDAKPAWVSYESDAEIGELVGWLSNGDAGDKELKESILNWQRYAPKGSSNAANQVQNEKQQSCFKLSNGAKAADSNFVMAKATTALEKKYGPCLGSDAIDIPKKRGQKGNITCEGILYRCECLELIWPSRHHCLSCHQTFSTSEELERHSDGKCSAGSPIQKNNRVNEDPLKGKRMTTETSVKKHLDDNGIGRASKGGKIEVSFNASKLPEPECPYDFEEICRDFVTQNSLKELVRDIGLIGSGGTPSLVLSVSPYLEDPALRSVPARKNEINSRNESMNLGKQVKQSTREISITEDANCDNDSNFPRCVGNDREEEVSQVDRLISNLTNVRSKFSSAKNRTPAGAGNCCVIPESSLRRLVGKVSQILGQLKINLLDMDAALPEDALRPSMACVEKRSAWRAFVKSAGSIYEMVQATIVLENMIKADYLRKEWWYWSSLSAAVNISTLSALALRIHTLDAVIIFEKSSPTSDSTEIQRPSCNAEGGTPPNLETRSHTKASNPLLQKSPPDATDHPKPKTRLNKRRKDSGG